jgi:hypothetical protein
MRKQLAQLPRLGPEDLSELQRCGSRYMRGNMSRPFSPWRVLGAARGSRSILDFAR